MSRAHTSASFFRRSLAWLGWSRSSSVLLGGFFLICGLIVYVWWPLAQQAMATIDWHGAWWLYMDWLLVGIFAFMSLTIIAHANLRRDALIVFVGMVGGLVIEAWGTQTNLWHYYTAERPPLWIIPAWPIASLSIDRLTRLLDWAVAKLFPPSLSPQPSGFPSGPSGISGSFGTSSSSDTSHTSGPSFLSGALFFRSLYWLLFTAFFALMLYFVAPTFGKSFTVMALLLVALLTLTPTDHRYAVLTFLAGSGLGYFLELWGTTRQCWIYYTFQTPPFFAVVAHGMAAVAFWRAGLMVKWAWGKLTRPWISRFSGNPGMERK